MPLRVTRLCTLVLIAAYSIPSSLEAADDSAVVLERDIPYAGTDNPRQRLDLLLPAARDAKSPLPVIAYVHGGAWRGGDKRHGIGRLRELVGTGRFAAVSIGYRLSQEAKWPAQIHDVKAAIRWIRAHAKKHGLDPDRIGAWGHSAGGHLVAMLGTSAGDPRADGSIGPHQGESTRVRCVADFFGPTDFLRMSLFPSRLDHEAEDSPESQLVGGPIREREAAVRSANPVTYVSSDDAPFLIVHGTADALVPFDQSKVLHRALEKAKVDSTLVRVLGGKHGGFRHHQVSATVDAFWRRHLLGEEGEILGGTVVEPRAPSSVENQPKSDSR